MGFSITGAHCECLSEGCRAMELYAEIERLRNLLSAARKHIDHEEQSYLAREISLVLDFK